MKIPECIGCSKPTPPDELTVDGYCYPCCDPVERVNIGEKLVEAVNEGLLRAYLAKGKSTRGSN